MSATLIDLAEPHDPKRAAEKCITLAGDAAQRMSDEGEDRGELDWNELLDELGVPHVKLEPLTCAAMLIQVGSGSVSGSVPVTQSTILRSHVLVVVRDIPPSLRQSLNAKLVDAEKTLADGESESACDDLKAFIAQARAQSGRKLTADLAAVLIEHPTRIRTVLACRPAQR